MANHQELVAAWTGGRNAANAFFENCRVLAAELVRAFASATEIPAGGDGLRFLPGDDPERDPKSRFSLPGAMAMSDRGTYELYLFFLLETAPNSFPKQPVRIKIATRVMGGVAYLEFGGRVQRLAWPIDQQGRSELEQLARDVSDGLADQLANGFMNAIARVAAEQLDDGVDVEDNQSAGERDQEPEGLLERRGGKPAVPPASFEVSSRNGNPSFWDDIIPPDQSVREDDDDTKD